MKQKLIAGNWKMNGSLSANEALVRAVLAGGATGCQVAMCVPSVYFFKSRRCWPVAAYGLVPKMCRRMNKAPTPGRYRLPCCVI